MKPKLVFFGNEKLATGITTQAPILSALIEAGYQVVAVVQNQSNQVSRGSGESAVADLAQMHNIPLLTDPPLALIPKLKSYKADFGVLAAYGRIVPQELIDLFPHGIINIHPSLLPHYRGTTPIESALLNGDTETGLTLMQLSAQMDAGPVFEQVSIPVPQQEKKIDLYLTLSKLGTQLLLDSIPGILARKIVPKVQDESLATYTKTFTKSDGQIEWKKPASQLEREVRAYAGWPSSYTSLFGRDLIITQASVLPDQDEPGQTFTIAKQLAVYTGRGALLIEKLKPAGKAEMNSQAFLAGIRPTSE